MSADDLLSRRKELRNDRQRLRRHSRLRNVRAYANVRRVGAERVRGGTVHATFVHRCRRLVWNGLRWLWGDPRLRLQPGRAVFQRELLHAPDRLPRKLWSLEQWLRGRSRLRGLRHRVPQRSENVRRPLSAAVAGGRVLAHWMHRLPERGERTIHVQRRSMRFRVPAGLHAERFILRSRRRQRWRRRHGQRRRWLRRHLQPRAVSGMQWSKVLQVRRHVRLPDVLDSGVRVGKIH